eukprot:g17319.t1
MQSGRRSWVLLCCWLVAFLINGGGGGDGDTGWNVEPGRVRRCSGGADAADVTADLAQPPEDNNLGRLTRACSSFCRAGIDGLDLWMSLKEVCVTSSSPDFLEQMATEREGSAESLPSASSRQSSSLSNRYSSAAAAVDSGIFSATQHAAWPLLHSILFVSTVSTLGLFAGFRMGSTAASIPKAAMLPLL